MKYSWISFSVGVNMEMVDWKNTHEIQKGEIQVTYGERMPREGGQEAAFTNIPFLLEKRQATVRKY